MLAIIGGSGLTQLANLDVSHREVVRTPYGEPSGAITFGQICGREVAFLARHGYGHTIPPHEVNYRANIWALHAQGVKNVVAVATVGGIHSSYRPGMIVMPDQIIDYTYGREHTYSDGTKNEPVLHVDFTHPFSAPLRQRRSPVMPNHHLCSSRCLSICPIAAPCFPVQDLMSSTTTAWPVTRLAWCSTNLRYRRRPGRPWLKR